MPISRVPCLLPLDAAPYPNPDPSAVPPPQVQHADGLRRRRHVGGTRGREDLQRVFPQRKGRAAENYGEGKQELGHFLPIFQNVLYSYVVALLVGVG